MKRGKTEREKPKIYRFLGECQHIIWNSLERYFGFGSIAKIMLFEIPRLELSKLTRVVISNAVDAFTNSLFYFNTINWNVKNDIS